MALLSYGSNGDAVKELQTNLNTVGGYNLDVDGGFGEKVARVAAAHGLKVLVKGAPKKFEDRFDPKDLLTRAGLTVEKISADVLAHA